VSTTPELKGYQKKYLRALAHKFKPVLLIGQKGITGTVVEATREALDQHELIKIKFIESKDKSEKQQMASELVMHTGANYVGMIGHIAILFKASSDPDKRKITLPARPDPAD